MEALITRVRQPMIQDDKPARVEDAALTAEATQQGVPIEQKPNLSPTVPGRS